MVQDVSQATNVLKFSYNVSSSGAFTTTLGHDDLSQFLITWNNLHLLYSLSQNISLTLVIIHNVTIQAISALYCSPKRSSKNHPLLVKCYYRRKPKLK